MKIRQLQGAFLSQNIIVKIPFQQKKVTALQSNEESYLKGFGGWQGAFHRARSANVQSEDISEFLYSQTSSVSFSNGHKPQWTSICQLYFPWFSLSAIVEKSCHSDLSFFISQLATWEKISSPFSFRPSNCVSFVYIFGYTVVLCFLMYFPISGYQLGVECLWSLTNVHLAS